MIRRKYQLVCIWKLAAALAAVALFSGCRHAPLSYQLLRHGSGVLVIPPSQIATANSPEFDFNIKNARHISTSPANCDIQGDLISLRWQGRTAKIKLKSAAFIAEQEAAIAGQSGPRMFLDPLQSLEKFRGDLESLEAKNCLRQDEARRLRIALGERLPLPPEAAYRFRFGSFDLTGVFDLSSDFRLQITGPVYSSDTNDSATQIAGYETAYYVFTSAQKDDRVRISLASVTETDRGKSPIVKSKPQNALSFPDAYGYFCIVFRTDASASEHITIATILSATDKKTLEEATRQRQSSPSDSCDAVSVPGTNCMMFPAKVGVGHELRVRVNGQDAFVPIGGAVGGAIGHTRPLDEIVKTLQVRRLYQGHLIPVKFDPTSRAIFGLVLMPGDEITF
jgi:hypothetical protein